MPQPEPTTLTERLDRLAKGIFGYLKSCGEQPLPSISYIIKVHNGFMRDWYPKIEDVSYQLGICGYVDYSFGELIGTHHDAFSYNKIRQIAEYLLKIKNEMELHGLRQSSLTERDVDAMSSDELKKRWNEPGFQSDVNMLEAFKKSR